MSNRKLAFGGAGALAALAVVGAVLAAPVPATGRPLAPAVGYALLQGTHLALWAEDRGTGTGLDIYAVLIGIYSVLSVWGYLDWRRSFYSQQGSARETGQLDAQSNP